MRRPARARFALAGALTLAFLVVFASFGGVAYATGAASKAASAVSKKAGGSDSKSGSTQRNVDRNDRNKGNNNGNNNDSNNGNNNNGNNGNNNNGNNGGNHDDDDDHGPAWHQYGHDWVAICHRSRSHGAHTLVLPRLAAYVLLRLPRYSLGRVLS